MLASPLLDGALNWLAKIRLIKLLGQNSRLQRWNPQVMEFLATPQHDCGVNRGFAQPTTYCITVILGVHKIYQCLNFALSKCEMLIGFQYDLKRGTLYFPTFLPSLKMLGNSEWKICIAVTKYLEGFFGGGWRCWPLSWLGKEGSLWINVFLACFLSSKNYSIFLKKKSVFFSYKTPEQRQDQDITDHEEKYE